VKLDDEEWVYVADSAAMSLLNLKQAKATKAFLITRRSDRLKIIKQALELVDSDEASWSELISFAEKQVPTIIF
jgi:transposase